MMNHSCQKNKPSVKRIKGYDISSYFNKDMDVLDIGSNNGFIACHIAPHVKSVDGIELNPYLNKIAEDTKAYLGIDNVRILEADFVTFEPDRKYGAVFSLSNHHTIDGNLDMNFESYIKKIYDMLEPRGLLFFESHDIDTGDKDLDLKFEIASCYFELEKYKMVRALHPAADIDKLFAIFKRRGKIIEKPDIDFKLESARNKYTY